MVSLQKPRVPTPHSTKGWGERVDIKTIEKIPVPALGPDTWRPLPHAAFTQMVEQAFERHGFEISEPTHYRANSRKKNADLIRDLPEWGRFLSLYGIAHARLPFVKGLWWEAGAMNSYDMSLAATLGGGERIEYCANGQFLYTSSGFRRKHTSGIDRHRDGLFQHIYDLVDHSIGQLFTQLDDRADRIERMQRIECTDDDARYIIMQAAKKDIIGAAGTMKVLEHWETPEHAEFKDRSVWSLNNAFTSHDRGRNVLTQSLRFHKLDTILNERFGPELSGESPDLVTNSAADF